jgi:hypothetical protein
MRTVVGITEPESASTAQFARTSDIESSGATSDAVFVVIYSMALAACQCETSPESLSDLWPSLLLEELPHVLVGIQCVAESAWVFALLE